MVRENIVSFKHVYKLSQKIGHAVIAAVRRCLGEKIKYPIWKKQLALLSVAPGRTAHQHHPRRHVR